MWEEMNETSDGAEQLTDGLCEGREEREIQVLMELLKLG